MVGNLAELEEDLAESADYILSGLPAKLTHLILSGDSGEILTPLIKKSRPELKTEMITSVQEMIEVLKPLLDGQTVIGIKGSRSSHMERVLLGLMDRAFSCTLERCPRLNRCDVCELL